MSQASHEIAGAKGEGGAGIDGSINAGTDGAGIDGGDVGGLGDDGGDGGVIGGLAHKTTW